MLCCFISISNHSPTYGCFLYVEPEKIQQKSERYTRTCRPCWLVLCWFVLTLQTMKDCMYFSQWCTCSVDWRYKADHEKMCLTYVWCSGLFQVQQPILNSTGPHTHVAYRSKNTISFNTIQCVSNVLHFTQNKALRAHAMVIMLIQGPCKDFHVFQIFSLSKPLWFHLALMWQEPLQKYVK